MGPQDLGPGCCIGGIGSIRSGCLRFAHSRSNVAGLLQLYAVAAGGEIKVEENTSVTGNLHSNDEIDLKPGSSVIGDVSATGEIKLDGDLSGNAQPSAPFLTLPTLPSPLELQQLADRVVTGDQLLQDETIDDVLFINGKVEVQGSLNGSGTIIATGEIKLLEGAATLDPETRLSLISYKKIDVGKNRQLRAALRALETIKIEEGSHVTGVIIADQSVDVKKNSTIEFLDFDQTPPVLDNTDFQPSDGAVLAESVPVISASFTDDLSGIGATTFVFLLDGIDRTANAQVSTEGFSFTPAPPLADGSHTVEVSIEDNSGNSTASSWTFAVDTAPPVVDITSPVDGVTVSQTPIHVEGSVTDASPIAAVNVNGVAADVAGTGFSVDVPLSPGANQIIVEASDAAGNVASATISVTLATDSTPPSLSILWPPSGIFVADSQPEVEVSYADDDAGVDLASLTFTADGSILDMSCNQGASQATCTPLQPLGEGAVTLVASLSDLAGNTETAQVNFIVDTVGVEVAIVDPADRAITGEEQIEVSGTVGPEISTVEVSGVAAIVSGGTFSASIPLREGTQMIVALASKINGNTGTESVTVTRDNIAPIVRIETPRDGLVAASASLPVAGLVNDIVNGATNAQVLVNGIDAVVENGTFLLTDLALVPGPNLIEAVATDAVGNEGRHQVTVNYLQRVGAQIDIESGNGQIGTVNQLLPEPFVAIVTDGLGNPLAGRMVTFQVVRNSGTLSAGGAQGLRSVQAPTDGSGRAAVSLTLGDIAGEGNNRVVATGLGVVGEAEFCASALDAPADKILMVAGDNQRGQVSHPLPVPLEALVVDAHGNPIPGVEVAFEVTKGAGKLDGQSIQTKTTGLDGIARAVLTVGPDEGINNNVVTASYEGLTGLPATFTSSGLIPGDPAQTRYAGVVLDNAHTPIPGAVVSIGGTEVEAITDAEGQFELFGVPVGAIHLHIDPTNSPRPETFPPLEFETVTVAGRRNNLGQPILIPALDTANSKLVGGPEDVTLTMEDVEGLELTVFANSVTFPDGSTTGQLTISQVHLDKVPMPPPSGTFFMPPAWTIQPAGVAFDPPARITIPNDGLPPGRIIDIFQFDHALNQFINIGKGTVSQDAFDITSDPGFGITRSGWGGCGQPQPPTTCTLDCGPCKLPDSACTACEPNPEIVAICESEAAKGMCGSPCEGVDADGLALGGCWSHRIGGEEGVLHCYWDLMGPGEANGGYPLCCNDTPHCESPEGRRAWPGGAAGSYQCTQIVPEGETTSGATCPSNECVELPPIE